MPGNLGIPHMVAPPLDRGIRKFSTLVDMTELIGRIICRRVLLSPELWILSSTSALPRARSNQMPKTGCPEIVPVQTWLYLILSPPSIASLEAGIGGKVKLDDLGDELTSRQDNGGNPLQYAVLRPKGSTRN